jgi:RNA polymerase sigma-70 factor (sigma-E family)
MSWSRLSPDAGAELVSQSMEHAGPPPTGARALSSPDGEDGWLTSLYVREAATLVRMARFFVDDRAAAEDLVQEAFIRLSRSRDRVRDPDAATAYLRAIVLNLARDHNRRGLMSFRHRPPADPAEPSVEDQVTGREEARAVVAALRDLPRRQRDCVVLHYYLELPVAEVATTLGLSPNSVKTHLQRGLRAMETALAGRRATATSTGPSDAALRGARR